MKRLAALSALCIVLSVFVFALPVSAQVTPSPSFSPAPINLESGGLSEAEYSKQLNALQVTYRNQLTTYRSDEKAYQVAKEQYYKIQTLASLEEAVRKTRQVMLTRLDVLETYFTISKLMMQNQKGLDTAVKNDALQQIDIMIDDLKTHRKNVESSSDRTLLLTTAGQFVTLGNRIKTLSNRIASLIGYGRLQTVDDKMIAIKQELQQQTEQEEKDPLLLAQKKRGLEEVQRNLDEVNTTILKVRNTLSLSKSNQNISTSAVSKDLSTIFAGLSRSISYLEELVKS